MQRKSQHLSNDAHYVSLFCYTQEICKNRIDQNKLCIQVTGKMSPSNGFNQKFKESDSPLCNKKKFPEVL